MTPRAHLIFAAAASVVVAATIAWGFVLVGSPANRRLELLDERRLDDLQAIAREIQAMVVAPDKPDALKAELPQTLEEAARRATDQRLSLQDPETGQPYSYTVKDDHTYELCADFLLERDWGSSVFWNHGPGRKCFTIDVLDPPPFY